MVMTDEIACGAALSDIGSEIPTASSVNGGGWSMGGLQMLTSRHWLPSTYTLCADLSDP